MALFLKRFLVGHGGAHDIFKVIYLIQLVSFTVDGDPL